MGIKIRSTTSRQVSLLVILIVGLSSMIGCSSISGIGDTGDGGSSNIDEDDGGGFSETFELDSVDTPDSSTSDPSDPQVEDQPVLSDEALPDFSIVDVNVESARYEEAVSPRDYLGQISAWYFGHAT